MWIQYTSNNPNGCSAELISMFVCKVIIILLLVLFLDLICIYTYSKILLSRTWFISNTPLISKLITGSGHFHYTNDFKNSWYREHVYLEYPAYLEIYLGSQTLLLHCLSRSAVKFLVCLTFLATLPHQFTPAAIYIHYNLCYLRRLLILRCPRSIN
jgi:hypothetical protein